MSDQKQKVFTPSSKDRKRDRSAKMIHDLATEPPPKDMASIKAASDVYEANKKDSRLKLRDRESAHQ